MSTAIRHTLSVDIETYSSVPIAKAGAYRYAASEDFEILLFAYSYDNQPVQIIDLANGETLPSWLLTALVNPAVVKSAYNASFEFNCLSKFIKLYPAQWRCTMVHGLYCGYTAGLDATGRALGLPEEKQKLATGKALIRYFCVPCKATRSNGGRSRNLPKHDPEKWELFKQYCMQDVVTEMEIERRLSSFPLPEKVQKQWETDLAINRRGVAVDMPFVEGALAIGEEVREKLIEEGVELTGLANPNSVSQMKDWLNVALATDGVEEISTLSKATVSELLGREDNTPEVQRVLQIRQELGKTSTKKYDAIAGCVCPDGRVRGLLQFYGANRTGRYAGRLVQVQNLPRTYTDPIEPARRWVKEKDADALAVVYGSVPDTLSQLIRTAFVAKPGMVLIDADFSAIEARVISWMANETWRLDVFRSHGKIYEASASQMFGVPIERIVKGNPEYTLRAKGKVAELALGYQGGPGALTAMGALNMGLTEEELPEIVSRWRGANPRIVSMWYALQDAAVKSIEQMSSETVWLAGGEACVKFRTVFDPVSMQRYLLADLPSGRSLFYIAPKVTENRFGGKAIEYYGVNQTTKKWQVLETYSGKIAENLTQAIARDCLAEAIDRLEAAGYPIVFHVHDEVVIEKEPYDTPEKMLRDVCTIMSQRVTWAPSLPLSSAGWVGDFFTKD